MGPRFRWAQVLSPIFTENVGHFFSTARKASKRTSAFPIRFIFVLPSFSPWKSFILLEIFQTKEDKRVFARGCLPQFVGWHTAICTPDVGPIFAQFVSPLIKRRSFLQYCNEGFKRNIHFSDPLHFLFAFLLSLQELHFPCNIAAILQTNDTNKLKMDLFCQCRN